jgi:predicted phage tail protein|tara:strand:+ start:247 stop:876 length:630 start_codon:yes stop_codon:yes gene_type:complete
MLRKLKLYGELAEFVGHKEFEIEVNSLPKAISFLINNFPQVEPYMNPNYYHVKIGNYEINEEEIHYPIGQQDIHIIPVIAGSGGLGRALFGAALIAGAFIINPALGFSSFAKTQAVGITAFGSLGLMTKAAVYLGGYLVLSGVSEMLFPLPKPPEREDDPRVSFNFAGTQNTTRAGTPIPIVYGEIFTGSVLISGAIDTVQVEVEDDSE